MAQAPAAAAPKSKKMLIIGVVVVLILALAGGGAFMMMHKKGGKKSHDKTEQVAEESSSEPAAEEESSGEEGKAPVFVPLETFTVNLQPDPDEQYLQIELTLQVPSEKDVDVIKTHMPEVRNRVLLLLSSKKASQLKSPEGKTALTDEITEEIKKPFAGSKTKQKLLGIFFTSFVIQ